MPFEFPTYAQFILRYPVFGLDPYDQVSVQDKLDEIQAVYPQILTCLKDDPSKWLALKLAFMYLCDLETVQCQSGYAVKEYKSLTSSVVYQLSKGDPHAMANNGWGARLIRLFKQHGCYLTVGKGVGNDCNCSCH